MRSQKLILGLNALDSHAPTMKLKQAPSCPIVPEKYRFCWVNNLGGGDGFSAGLDLGWLNRITPLAFTVCRGI
jgi:hypothetical protein